MTKKTDDQTTDDPKDGPVTPPTNAEPTTPPDAPVTDEVVDLGPPTQPEPISEEDANKVVYRFIGHGGVTGVPERDLTVLDVERLVPEQIRLMTVAAPGRYPLYEAV